MKPIERYLGRYSIAKNGNIRNSNTKKLLSPFMTGNGYWAIKLWNGCRQKTELLHRLIAEAFVPNPENYPVVNHKNGIKTDNRPCNLEWCTQKMNLEHAVESGLRVPLNTKGQSNGMSKLKTNDIPVIRELYSQGLTYKQVAKLYSVGHECIYKIIKGENWSHA